MSGIINSAGSKSGVIGTTELDYEEGLWTPSLAAYGGSYDATPAGFYTKIGSLITCSFFINRATGADASHLQISDMPFVSHDGTRAEGGFLNYSYGHGVGDNAIYRLFMISDGNYCYGYTQAGEAYSYDMQGSGAQFGGTIIYRNIEFMS